MTREHIIAKIEEWIEKRAQYQREQDHASAYYCSAAIRDLYRKLEALNGDVSGESTALLPLPSMRP